VAAAIGSALKGLKAIAQNDKPTVGLADMVGVVTELLPPNQATLVNLIVDGLTKLSAALPESTAKKLKEGFEELAQSAQPRVINTSVPDPSDPEHKRRLDAVAIVFLKPKKEVKA
jgi:hypothetical protein